MKIFKNTMMILMLCITGIVSAKQTGVVGVRKPSIQPSEVTIPVSQQPQPQSNIQAQVQQEEPLKKKVKVLPQVPKTVSSELDKKLAELTSLNITLQKELKKQQFLLRKEQARKGVKPIKGWFSWLWGAEAASIEEYKSMIKEKLDNVEKYPTFKIKEEALDLGLVELREPGYDDVRIMKLAQDALRKDLLTESASLLLAQQIEQKEINDQIAKLRDKFGFDLSEVLPDDLKIGELNVYLQNIANNTKDFVVNNITNKNAIILLRVIISEFKRVERIIDILSKAQQVPGAVPMTSAQPSAGATPTGKSAGQ